MFSLKLLPAPQSVWCPKWSSLLCDDSHTLHSVFSRFKYNSTAMLGFHLHSLQCSFSLCSYCICVCVCVHKLFFLFFRLRLCQIFYAHRGSVCDQCPPWQPDHASKSSFFIWHGGFIKEEMTVGHWTSHWPITAMFLYEKLFSTF